MEEMFYRLLYWSILNLINILTKCFLMHLHSNFCSLGMFSYTWASNWFLFCQNSSLNTKYYIYDFRVNTFRGSINFFKTFIKHSQLEHYKINLFNVAGFHCFALIKIIPVPCDVPTCLSKCSLIFYILSQLAHR